MPLRISPASLEDVPLIARMAERIWKVHYVPIIGEEQVNYMLQKGYSAEGLAASMEQGEKYFLCYADDKAIGYISVTSKSATEYFLNKFYLEINEQGKGYGTEFFELLLKEIPALQILRLQVNRLNYKTINFYFRLGFTIEYAKDFDIGGGYSMDDYVMAFRR
ncbi:MAG TPA: GNAT family N-acetyltransferase [Bacteroidia bacterium]|nr:GNAT family N-acetyltransferase [Bacteroidia bacterium]